MSVAVESAEASLARRWEALRGHLTERQRRLWLGAEARELGTDGAVRVAAAVGVAADTVRRGRVELDDPARAPVRGWSARVSLAGDASGPRSISLGWPRRWSR